MAQENGFCPLHFKAYQNVQEKFKAWQKALGISWTQYITQIQKNSLTGEWAKEVAKHIIEEEQQCQKK